MVRSRPTVPGRDSAEDGNALSLPFKLAIGAAIVYFGVLAVLWAMQDRLIHLPHVPGRELTATPEDRDLAYTDVTIRAHDDVRLHGWFLPLGTARATLLFFHGNAGNISHRLDSLALFHELGLQVLIIDYRGYGRSEGRASEAGLHRDAEAAWRYLTEERGLPPERIVIFGRSLGGAVATRLAAKRRPAGLILESAFTSVADLAAERFPMFPVRPLLRHHYETENVIGHVEAPVLVVHSRDDEIVPVAHGRRVFRNARQPRHWVEIQGAHNDAFLASRERYTDALRDFLDRYLPAIGDR